MAGHITWVSTLMFYSHPEEPAFPPAGRGIPSAASSLEVRPSQNEMRITFVQDPLPAEVRKSFGMTENKAGIAPVIRFS
jgi:hypothetical protein